MRIVVVNQSARVKPSEADAMVTAVSRQLARHFCPAWSLAVPALLYASSASAVPQGSHVVTIADNDGGDAGYLGYHTNDDGGAYYAVVLVDPVLASGGGVLLCDKAKRESTSVAAVLSHEVLEMVADPYINLWCDGPKISAGSQYALEVADPVEADSYVVDGGHRRGVSVEVSNFIFPEWTDPLAPPGARLDQMHLLKHPFTMTPGGYMVVRDGAKASEVYGAEYPDWRRAGKSRSASRSARMRGRTATT